MSRTNKKRNIRRSRRGAEDLTKPVSSRRTIAITGHTSKVTRRTRKHELRMHVEYLAEIKHLVQSSPSHFLDDSTLYNPLPPLLKKKKQGFTLRKEKPPTYREKFSIRESHWENTTRFAVSLAAGIVQRCDCTKRTKKLSIVGLTGISVKEVESCGCGLSAARLIGDHKAFPVSPLEPFRAYDTYLLRLMRNQTLSGPMSKQAWANGLRKTHEQSGLKVHPNYYKSVS